MQKGKWSLILFFNLAIILSIGVTYLALNQTTKKETQDKQKETLKMSVALVNEDKGIMKNGSTITFGNDFVKSVEKDQKHEWYVVSRGVAESGLHRGIYNVMIIIPNDFSAKSMNIQSNSPEKVTLRYKINSGSNKDINLEAEKTVNTILEDFNRKMIDVYFVSIIENLHQAQTNIKDIVDTQGNYTGVYNQTINNPLANYTNQFKTIQDFTGVSKENFQGLQDHLNNFGLALQVGTNSTGRFQDELSSFTNLQSENGEGLKDFSNQFNNYHISLSSENVMNQLAMLENSNRMIYQQFQNDQAGNLVKLTKSIQDYLADVNSKISQTNDDLKKRLSDNLDKYLYEKLLAALKSDGINVNRSVTLIQLLPDLNNSYQNTFKDLIMNIPTFDPSELENTGIPNNKLDEYKNVISISKKYYLENQDKFSGSDPTGNRGTEFSKLAEKRIEDLKNPSIGLPFTTKTFINTELEDKGILDVWLSDNRFMISELTLHIGSKEYNIPIVNPNNSQSFDFKVDKKTTEDIWIEGLLTLSPGITDAKLYDPALINWSITKETVATPPQNSTIVINGEPIIETLIKNSFSDIYAAMETIRNYEKLSELFKLFYGINVGMTPNDFEQAYSAHTLPDIANSIGNANGQNGINLPIYYQLNKQDVTNQMAILVRDYILHSVRSDITSLQSRIQDYLVYVNLANNNSASLSKVLIDTSNEANTMNNSLGGMLNEINRWREDSQSLVDYHIQIIDSDQNEKTATLALGSEFNQLFEQSNTLLQRSSENLITADHVYKTFEGIDKEANSIHLSGSNIVKQAETLSNQLLNKFGDDKDFARNFSKVLANSKTGERRNNAFYDFISNPINKENEGVILTADKFTPYVLVLVIFIISLFISYVISTFERKRNNQDIFQNEKNITRQNMPITILLIGTSVIVGGFIGFISGRLFKMQNLDLVIWIGISIAILLAMTLFISYLFRQMKLIGMFLALSILSLYLFLTNAVGKQTEQASLEAKIKIWSPLQYVEDFFTNYLAKDIVYEQSIYFVVGVIFVMIVANLFVLNRKKVGDMNEEIEQA